MIKAKAVPDVPSVAPLVVTMRADRQEKMILALILSIVFTSDDLVQSRNVTVFTGGK